MLKKVRPKRLQKKKYKALQFLMEKTFREKTSVKLGHLVFCLWDGVVKTCSKAIEIFFLSAGHARLNSKLHPSCSMLKIALLHSNVGGKQASKGVCLLECFIPFLPSLLFLT